MAFAVADLFAGAGGFSTGCLQAATKRGQPVQLVAVNHWPIAVETHTRNHPEAKHYCHSVETLDPRVAVPGGRLDLLIAAPECVFFSTARGGKPIDDQRRASAWHVLRWLEMLRVEELLLENVPEMRDWAPLGANGRPLKSKKGSIFRAFIAAIEALNYRVEWKVLNAADFGAATTRRRLFIRARRGRKAIAWPSPTHSKTGTATLFGGVKKWRAAREIIDWSLPSQSIFERKRPLKPATLRRILEGLRRFGGPQLEPFLVVLRNHMDGQSIDGPVPTVAAQGQHVGVAEPMLVQLTHGVRSHSVDAPVPTVVAGHRGELGVVEPCIIGMEHGGRTYSTDEPLPTITTAKGGAFAVAEPFIVQPAHGEGGGRGSAGRVTSVDDPLGTQPASNRFGVCEPYIVPFRSDNDGRAPRVKSLDDPLHTVTTENPIGLAEPFLVPLYSERDGQAPRVHSVDDPVPVIPASGDGKFAVVEPFVLGQQSNGAPRTTDQPIPTVASAGKVALVEPFILGQQSGSVPRPVEEPAPTVAADGAIGLVESFVITPGGADLPNGRAVSDPLPTITGSDRFAVVEPMLMATGGRAVGRVDSVADPLRTITAAAGHTVGVVEPLISKYNRTAKAAKPVSEPLDTISTRDRYALVQPVVNGYVLDIRFRMLQPHELSAAMSFPRSYVFTGNKGDQIRQIGNAVDCSMAEALCGAILDARRPLKREKEAVA